MKKYILKFKSLFIKAIILISLSSALQLSFDFFKGNILDLALKKESGFLYLISLAYIVAVILKALTHFLYTKNYNYGKSYSLGSWRFDFFKGILKKSFPDFKKESSAYYINKYSNEFSLVEQLFFQSSYSTLQTMTELFFALIGFFIIDFQLAILAIVLIGISISIPFLTRKWVSSKNEDMLRFMTNHIGKVKNFFDGHEIIYNYRAKDKIFIEFNKSNQALKEKKMAYTGAAMAAQYISKAFSQISLLIVMAFSIFLIRKGQLSIGRFVTATNILISIQAMTTYIASNVQSILTSKVPIKSINEVAEFEPEEFFGDGEIDSVRKIEYENVDFSYKGGKKILEDFNFESSNKGIYLIQGESGSGKSTIMNLLLRYYKLNKGEILLNNINIEKIENLNSQISIMRQEANFFDDTLRENLRVFDEKISDEKIIKYMRELRLEKYANKESLDNTIVNNGSNFSGGERRRLSFIRSILKKSDILILDEPFANVDEKTISNIAKIIGEIENSFIFLITHQMPKNYDLKIERCINI